MSERITYVSLEQEYNELINKMITLKKECEHSIDKEKTIREIYIKHINRKKKKFIISASIIISIFVIALTFVTGTYFFPSFGTYQREELANGKEEVCYVTDTGYCYHKINCRYLRSVNRTTMYQAELSGYSPCSYCWNYPRPIYHTVTVTNYLQKYGTIFAVFACVSLILFYIIYKKVDRKSKIEIDNENSKFEKYQKILLKRVFDKLEIENENDFEKVAKSLSEVPNDVDYQDNLPTTKDGRFMVYMSYSGKCYHSDPLCKGNYLPYETHIFSAMQYRMPCYFCATEMEIPEWHNKYIELINLYKSIVDMCK